MLSVIHRRVFREYLLIAEKNITEVVCLASASVLPACQYPVPLSTSGFFLFLRSPSFYLFLALSRSKAGRSGVMISALSVIGSFRIITYQSCAFSAMERSVACQLCRVRLFVVFPPALRCSKSLVQLYVLGVCLRPHAFAAICEHVCTPVALLSYIFHSSAP